MAKIKLTENQKKKLIENIINESISDVIKSNLAKLTKKKPNLAANQNIKSIINKAGNDALKTLISNIESNYSGFPNNKNQNDFILAIQEIVKFYDNLVISAKLPSTDPNYIDPHIVNTIINDLNEYIEKVVTHDLSGIYKKVDENDAKTLRQIITTRAGSQNTKTKNSRYSTLMSVLNLIKPVYITPISNQPTTGSTNTQTNVPRVTSTDNLNANIKSLFKYLSSTKNKYGLNKSNNTGNGMGSQKLAPKQGSIVSIGGKRATVINPNLPNGMIQVRYDSGSVYALNPNRIDNVISENYYIKDKRVIDFLNKKLPYDRLNIFEEILKRIELIRNQIKNFKTDDKIINNFIQKLNTNPIMITDFQSLLKINPDNPNDVNSIKTFIEDVINTLFSGNYKNINIIDKLDSLSEDQSYNAIKPNKSFIKDAQDRGRFKNNLIKFLETIIGLYQYMNKLKG